MNSEHEDILVGDRCQYISYNIASLHGAVGEVIKIFDRLKSTDDGRLLCEKETAYVVRFSTENENLIGLFGKDFNLYLTRDEIELVKNYELHRIQNAPGYERSIIEFCSECVSAASTALEISMQEVIAVSDIGRVSYTFKPAYEAMCKLGLMDHVRYVDSNISENGAPASTKEMLVRFARLLCNAASMAGRLELSEEGNKYWYYMGNFNGAIRYARWLGIDVNSFYR